MPEIREVFPNIKKWLSDQIPIIKYGGIILAVFLLIILLTVFDWRAILGLRAADSCPAILGDPVMGKITVTGDVTLNAQDYSNGIVDCSETDIEVSTGVTVTLQGYDNGDSDWTNDYGITWNVHSLDVKTGAVVLSDAKGYAATRGTGAGETGTGTTAGGGGGYGGAGGEGQAEVGNPTTEGGTTYGSATNPAFMGSGGGNAGAGGAGGAGAGFSKIVSTGTVTINGRISANGGNSSVISNSSGGGGAGGTVFIEAATLAGNGIVETKGGNAASATYRGGGGGGGRLVMYCTSSNTFTGQVSVAGGTGGVQNGQEGTSIGPTCYPNDPTSLGQYKNSVSGGNILNIGDSTQATTIVYQLTVSDVDSTDTLYPQVEIAEVGTDFTGAPTITGSGVNYSGTPIVTTVTQTNVTKGKQYHWRARVKDEEGAVSDWVSFGGNGEDAADFIVSDVPTTLQKTSGDNQTGTVSAQLAEPIKVRVLDNAGLPVADYSITWNVVLGGGEVSSGLTYTDSAGYTQVNWTLGSEAGANNNKVRAIHSGLSGSPMEFSASASADVVDHYQVEGPSSALTNENFQIIITALDQYDNVVTSASNQVNLSAVLASDGQTPGNGTLSPPNATLVSGTVTVSNTTYTVAESIKIKVTDSQSKVGLSNSIAIVDSYGTCPDADGIIDTSQTWTANLTNGGVFDCTGIDIQVTSSAVLTLESYDNGNTDYNDDFGVTILADSLTVDVGSFVTANGKGYRNSAGPGGGTSGYCWADGGVYGGQVHSGHKEPFGDAYEPTSLGSRGAGSYGGLSYGGGAIKLNISGITQINGTLSANATNSTGDCSSGGSGGSIWINTATLSGGGIISANGGDGRLTGKPAEGGAGGRIAIYYTNNSFNIDNIDAYSGSGEYYAGPGTIYLKPSSGVGSIYVNNNGGNGGYFAGLVEDTYEFGSIDLTQYGHLQIQGTGSTLNIANGTLSGDGTSYLDPYGTVSLPASVMINGINLRIKGTYSGATNVTIGTNGGLTLYAYTPLHNWSYTFGNITINNTGILNTVSYDNGDTNWTNDYGLVLNATQLTISSGGTFSADGLGYAGGKGPGVGSNVFCSATGPSHGGYGVGVTDTGKIYGNVYEPIDLGSGTGTLYGSVSGGGAVKIVAGTLAVEGTLSSDGLTSTASCNTGSAGGSLWIEADTINGASTGSISVDGKHATGANPKGGGGGGRIGIYYETDNWDLETQIEAGKIHAYGGYTGGAAGPGTIYTEQVPAMQDPVYDGNIYVSNNDLSGLTAAVITGTYDFEEINLIGYGHLDFLGTTSTLSLGNGSGLAGDGTSTLQSFGTITFDTNFTVQNLNVAIRGTYTGGNNPTIETNGTLTLYANTPLHNNTHTFENINVNDTGILKTVGYDNGDANYENDYGVIINATNITIAIGGKISCEGEGYAITAGPGKGTANAQGGSFGGYGRHNTAAPYGNVYEPVMLGSGGKSAKGGGAIKLDVSTALQVNGTITAQGGSNTTASGSGGGSGGSVWIDTGNLSGSGTITANGGSGKTSWDSNGSGGGAGGRIGLFYTGTNTLPVANVTAYGGTSYQGYGGSGTVYIEQVSGSPSYDGDLYINNNDQNYEKAGLISGTYQFDSLTLKGYGHLDILGEDSSITLISGSAITGDGTSDLNPYGTLNLPGTVTVEQVNLSVLGNYTGAANLTIGTNGGMTLYARTNKRVTEQISPINAYNFTALTINDTGILTLVGYDSGDIDYGNDYGVVIDATNITMATGGKISAKGYGYATGYGPGKGAANYDGGSYGGYGGSNELAPYGDVYEPEDLGSGGRNLSGGGAIKLDVSGELAVNGTIDASGSDSTSDNIGVGAGGSIWIKTGILSGSGTVVATGGNAKAGATGGAGGSGGRIGVYYTTKTLPMGNITAYGGSGYAGNGGPGTVYIEQVAGSPEYDGDLYINNNGVNALQAGLVSGIYEFNSITLTGYGHLDILGENSSITLTSGSAITGDGTSNLNPYGILNLPNTVTVEQVNLGILGDYTGANVLTIGANGGITLYARTNKRVAEEISPINKYTFNTLTINNTGTLTLVGYDSGDTNYENDYGVEISSANITIASGGSVSSTGKGYATASGPGMGASNSHGGSYGGYGRHNTNPSYGDIYEPEDLGSGGKIAAGGGAIKLDVSGTLQVNGSIKSEGASNTTASGSGAGSGGSIWIIAEGLSGGGTISTNGGTGKTTWDSNGSGGGSGGRVSIYYTSSTFPVTNITAYGGNSFQGYGGPGTVYLEQVPSDEEPGYDGDLYIDNNNQTGDNAGDFSAGTYTFDDVSIDDNIQFKILGQVSLVPQGVTFNLNGDFTAGTGSYIDGQGQGFSSSEGLGAGSDGSIEGGGDGSGGGGAAHGGDGGLGEDDGINGTTSGGESYGSTSEPLTLGSGGGESGAGAEGGTGGGALAIYALDGTITINGTINVDGTNGATSSPGGGGGAGGSILLQGDVLDLGVSSSLSAQGGSGGDDIYDGGGGGGGRISLLFGDSYTALGSLDESGGAGWQAGQEGTELGPIGYPNTPENMNQYEAGDSITIPVGGTTPQSEVVLKFLASDADAADTLTPEIEIRPIGASFTNEVTNTGNAVSFSGTPVQAEVSVPGLVLGSSYHWQARIRDNNGVYSEWASFGANSESQADFIVTEATKLVLTPSVSTVNAGGYLSLTVSAQDDFDNVDTAYRETITFTSSDSQAQLPNNYTFTSSDQGQHTFTNGVQLRTVGTQTVTAIDTSDSDIKGSITISVLPTNAISQNNSTVEADPETIENDGEEGSAITVTLHDAYNNPIIGKIVTLSSTGSGNTITQPVEATDEDGKAYGSISSNVIEEKIISATIPDDGITLNDTAAVTVRDSTPPVISNIQVTNITTSSATISWNTNESAAGQVEFGLGYLYGSTSSYDSNLSTTHSVTLYGLASGTTFYFRILARDASLNTSLSSNQTFTTQLTPTQEQTTELAILSTLISDVSISSALIKWQTNINSTAILEFGTTEDLGNSVEITDASTSHEYFLSGLQRDTKYYLRIIAISGQQQKVTDILDFTTLQDANAVRINDIEVKNIASKSATITFTTSKPATIILRYGKTRDYGEGELTSTEFLSNHLFDLTNLQSDSDYHFQITATDEDGFVTTSADQIFHTLSITSGEGGIFNIRQDRKEDELTVSWETTYPMTCYVAYGETPEYGSRTAETAPISGNIFGQIFNISGLNDVEVHYRIICTNEAGQTFTTRDLVYSSLQELPVTGIPVTPRWYEHPIVVALARYGVPGITAIGLLLQGLYLISKLGGLPNIISRAGMLFGAVFDRERKKKGWGIVYDLDRNLPIPFAVIRLYDAKTRGLVMDTVTDLKGRYMFIAEDGIYTIGVSHPDYIFPRAEGVLVKGRELIGKYLGGEIAVKKGIAISYDIPMISKAKAMEGVRYYSLKDDFKVWMDRFGKFINIVGGVLLILSILIAPTLLNFALLVFNIGVILIILVVNYFQEKNWGNVYNIVDFAHIPGAFVRLFDAKENKLVNTQMSDINGRYGFLTDEGEYLIMVEQPDFKMGEVKGKTVKSKTFGNVLKLTVRKDEIIKQNLPLEKAKEMLAKKEEETPFGE